MYVFLVLFTLLITFNIEENEKKNKKKKKKREKENKKERKKKHYTVIQFMIPSSAITHNTYSENGRCPADTHHTVETTLNQH